MRVMPSPPPAAVQLAGEQLCVGHLAEQLGAAQPLVSHHLKVLRAAGLVEPSRWRYWTYYRLRPGALDALADQLWLLARSGPAATACRRLAPAATAPPSPAAHPSPSARPAPPARGGPRMPFRDRQLDPTSRQTFARAIESLAEELRGIFSLETVERYVDESIDRLQGARVVDFIPLFVHRFARASESLAEEFRGIFSLETVERYVDESIDRLQGARVVDFIPLFVHRFARE